MPITEDASNPNTVFLSRCLEIYSARNVSSVDEFESDIRILVSIKRLLIKIKNREDDELTASTVGLLCNHIRVLFNVFGDHAFYMLEYTIAEPYYDVLFAGMVMARILSETEAVRLNPEVQTQLTRFKEAQ